KATCTHVATDAGWLHQVMRASIAPHFNSSSARENLAQFRRRRRGKERGGIDPFDGVDFVAQARLAPRPAGDERGDDKMRPNARALMGDRLDVTIERDDFGFDFDFFHKLPG